MPMPELLTPTVVDPYEPYRRESETGVILYAAGLPGYPANFSRDTLIAGIISGRADLL